MANTTIADLLAFRNRQMHLSEQMAMCLRDLEALVAVALTTTDFFKLTESTMHCYFSVVADWIQEIIELNQTNLRTLHDE